MAPSGHLLASPGFSRSMLVSFCLGSSQFAEEPKTKVQFLCGSNDDRSGFPTFVFRTPTSSCFFQTNDKRLSLLPIASVPFLPFVRLFLRFEPAIVQ